MRSMPAPQIQWDEPELVRRALARDSTAFRVIMERYNRRLYRIARSVVRDDTEAEDVVQEAYLSAFANLHRFRGDSSLSTWLARIALNEALGRVRRERHATPLKSIDDPRPEAQIIQFPQSATSGDPERTMAQRQILQLVEQTTDRLPEVFRVVFVARMIEG